MAKLDAKYLEKLAAQQAKLEKRVDSVQRAKESAVKLAAAVKKLKGEASELDK